MPSVRSFTSRVIPLPAENVDTDQIVPARYLKVTDKAGLGEALFRDWRFEADGSLKEPPFVLDQPEMAGPPDPARRRQLRLRLVARARAVGARRLGHPGRHHDQLRRHLPEQRAEERPAADRRRPGAHSPSCSSSSTRDPDVELTVDLESQVVHLPGDEDLPFDVDPFSKLMLLAGHRRARLPARQGSGDRRRGRPAHPPRIDTRAARSRRSRNPSAGLGARGHAHPSRRAVPAPPTRRGPRPSGP